MLGGMDQLIAPSRMDRFFAWSVELKRLHGRSVALHCIFCCGSGNSPWKLYLL